MSSQNWTNKGGRSSILKGGKVAWIIAIGLTIAVAAGIFVTLSNVASTTTYYVLNQPIPARTQITAEMLTEVVTSEGGEPRNAFDPATVTDNEVFSRFALEAGDVVSSSNAGLITPITEGIPDEFVVTSFTADAEYAAAGRIARGSYVDIIATTPDADTPTTSYVLRNVLVLDVNSDLSEATESAEDEDASASDTAAARAGVPAVYSVGLSPEDALVLASIRDMQITLVLSPRSYEIEGKVEPYDTTVSSTDLFSNRIVGDSGEGTDRTFGMGGEKPSDAPEDGQPTDGEQPVDPDADGAQPVDPDAEGEQPADPTSDGSESSDSELPGSTPSDAGNQGDNSGE